MNLTKRILLSLIATSLTLVGCSFDIATGNIVEMKEVIQEQKKLTLIVYMAADNDLESYGINNLKQMEHAAFTNMNVLVLMDRSSDYDQTNGDWSDTRLFEVKYDKSDSNLIKSRQLDCPILGLSKDTETELDMANYNVLRNLITFAKKEYSAEKYALVMWGHGTGWKYRYESKSRAVALDDTTNTYMSVADEGKALKNAGLSVIGFDTCFGGVLENIYELRDCAPYTVGCPDITPALGWNYKYLLEKLDACDFGDETIAGIMAQSCSVKTSVFDNSEVDTLFASFESLCKKVAESISDEHDRKYALDEMKSLKNYSYSQYPCDMFIDINSFAELYINSDDTDLSSKAGDLKNAVNKCCTTTGTTDGLVGVYFITKTSSQTYEPILTNGYIKNDNDDSICSFINKSNWWVPTISGQSESLLDKLFYKEI